MIICVMEHNSMVAKLPCFVLQSSDFWYFLDLPFCNTGLQEVIICFAELKVFGFWVFLSYLSSFHLESIGLKIVCLFYNMILFYRKK